MKSPQLPVYVRPFIGIITRFITRLRGPPCYLIMDENPTYRNFNLYKCCFSFGVQGYRTPYVYTLWDARAPVFGKVSQSSQAAQASRECFQKGENHWNQHPVTQSSESSIDSLNWVAHLLAHVLWICCTFLAQECPSRTAPSRYLRKGTSPNSHHFSWANLLLVS